MNKKDLPNGQLRILNFIKFYKQENGFPPLYTEVGKRFSIHVETVRQIVKILELKGFLVKHYGQRTIQILK